MPTLATSIPEAKIRKIPTISQGVSMFDFGEKTMNIWSNIYYTSLVVAAIAGAVSIASGFIQYKINGKILTKMQENVAVANSNAASSELKSKELDIQLKKLRLAVADRFIPQFIADTLVPELQKYKNKSVMVLCGESSTHEPLNFSQKLYQLFQASEWTSNLVNQHNTRVPPPRGIVIHATGEANGKIAEFIHNQFKQLGYLISINIQETGQHDITIQVLAK